MKREFRKTLLLFVICVLGLNRSEAEAQRRIREAGAIGVSFADRTGDHGRDLALYVARMNCGLSIPELTALAGMEPAAASKALQRMKERLPGIGN